MVVKASAPSNIALIKYMGKVAGGASLPANSSLSYTLESLKTHVEIADLGETATADQWSPLPGYAKIDLSEKGQAKFLNFFGDLKRLWKIEGYYHVRSANTFASDCGLASSASSFAALTKATYELAKVKRSEMDLTLEQLSQVSRAGSGSSCRSFFTPWAEWSGEGARPLALDLRLEHAVILIDEGKKSVSSSEAHKRIQTSLNWQGRIDRAEARFSALKTALSEGVWSDAFELCWAEFFDMHALFETSQPSFGFMTNESLAAVHALRQIWRETGDGPLITMDAGPNIHLLFRPEQRSASESWLKGYRVLRSSN